MLNAIALLDKLDTLSDEQIMMLYQKVFGNLEGELVLIDLLDKYFEFRPTSNDREAGSQAVIIYIKNRLLGIAEKEPTQGES